MLFVRHDNGECTPVVRCHVCNQDIVDTSSAFVVYPHFDEPHQTFRVAIAHAGSCHELLVNTLGNDLGPPQTLPLEDFLGRLQALRHVAC